MAKFDLNLYPTLNKLAQSTARIKFVIGPAGCLPKYTEVFTQARGWVGITEVGEDDKVAVFDRALDESRFEKLKGASVHPAAEFWRITKGEYKMVVCPEHNVWFKADEHGPWLCTPAEALARLARNTPVLVPFMVNGDRKWVDFMDATYELVESEEEKYCLEVSTGMFLVRQNGQVFLTGNSAKTSYLVVELFRLACVQYPDANKVRRSRSLIGRNTYQVLKSATMNTVENMLGWLGEALTVSRGSYPPNAKVRARLQDQTFIHWDIEFISFDSEDAESKLLGYEPTNGLLDEISELPEGLVDAVNRRLGRYPSKAYANPMCIVLLGATNGPRKDHWLYQWALGERDEQFKQIEEERFRETGIRRPQFELFRQPPALLRRDDGSWVPNPAAENIHNLPEGYGYYYNMLSDKEEKIKAYVEGEFSDIQTGKVVFPEFKRDLHIWRGGKDKLPTGMPLFFGFDFGRTPVCLIATATTSGKLIIIDEVMAEDVSVDTLYTDHLAPVLRSTYPRSVFNGAWGDPAGSVDTQAIDVSPFEVLLNHGIPIEDPGAGNKIQPRLEAVKQRLTRLDDEGRPSILITDNCKYLIEAISSTYIYETVRGRNDVVRDVPTKTHEGWASDLCDALQYLCLGYNAMVGMRKRREKSRPRLKRSRV